MRVKIYTFGGTPFSLFSEKEDYEGEVSFVESSKASGSEVEIPDHILSNSKNPKLEFLKKILGEKALESTCLTYRKHGTRNENFFAWEDKTSVNEQGYEIFATMSEINTFNLQKPDSSDGIISDEKLKGVKKIFLLPSVKLHFKIAPRKNLILANIISQVKHKANAEGKLIETLEVDVNLPVIVEYGSYSPRNRPQLKDAISDLLRNHNVTNLILPGRLLHGPDGVYDQYTFAVTPNPTELDALSELRIVSACDLLRGNTPHQWDDFLCEVKSSPEKQHLNATNEAAINELIRKITESFPYRRCELSEGSSFPEQLEALFKSVSCNFRCAGNGELTNFDLPASDLQALSQMIDYLIYLIYIPESIASAENVSEMVRVCALKINELANRIEAMSFGRDKTVAFRKVCDACWYINSLFQEGSRHTGGWSFGYRPIPFGIEADLANCKKELIRDVVRPMLNCMQAFDSKPSCKSISTFLLDIDMILINFIFKLLMLVQGVLYCLDASCGVDQDSWCEQGRQHHLYKPPSSELTSKMFELITGFDENFSDATVLTTCDKLNHYLCYVIEFPIAAIIYYFLITYSNQVPEFVRRNNVFDSEACMHVLGVIVVALIIPREPTGINKLNRCHVSGLWEKVSAADNRVDQAASIEITVQQEGVDEGQDDAALPLLAGANLKIK